MNYSMQKLASLHSIETKMELQCEKLDKLNGNFEALTSEIKMGNVLLLQLLKVLGQKNGIKELGV